LLLFITGINPKIIAIEIMSMEVGFHPKSEKRIPKRINVRTAKMEAKILVMCTAVRSNSGTSLEGA
jgi:hypothetical protein